MFYLVLFFIGLPLVELSLLLMLADRFSWAATLALVIVTGILGASLARWQGWRTANRIRMQLHAGQLPGEALLDAGMILLAAVLLVTPGILTDMVGFSLLVPACRRFYRRHLADWLRRHALRSATGARWTVATNRDEVFDPEVILDSDGVQRRP